MNDLWLRVTSDLADRLGGAWNFRLVVQPGMAIALALIDGVRDARALRPAFLWALAARPDHRAFMLAEGWKSIRNVFALSLGVDVIYQLARLGFVYPGETLLVAFALAIAPYAALRGPANRVARMFHGVAPGG